MLGAIIVGAVLAALLFPRVLRRVRDEDAERRLQRICRGDLAQASRLIEHQMQRRSGMSRGEAARRALDSLARDNR